MSSKVIETVFGFATLGLKDTEARMEATGQVVKYNKT